MSAICHTNIEKNLKTVKDGKHLALTVIEAAIELCEQEFKQALDDKSAKFKELQKRLQEANSGGDKGLEYFKWLDFDYLRRINKEQTKTLASKLRAKSFRKALVIGMGGSGINSMVLNNSLGEFISDKNSIEILIQNNLDPSSLINKLKALFPYIDKTLFILISKSGGTDEVRRNISTLINFWTESSSKTQEQILKAFAEQSVIITEPEISGKNNFLHKLNQELKSKFQVYMPWLENDPNIGGRFSMFSPVGLLSAELMGLDSDQLLEGAKRCADEFFKANSLSECLIAKLALLDIVLNHKGFINRYSMVYADGLEALNKFRAQLKGESLNKNGIDSTVHIPGIGTVNHHSDLELLFKDNNKIILEQIFFAEPYADHLNRDTGLDSFKDLLGQSNHESLIRNHIAPLNKYLLAKVHPVITTIISKQNEESLGYYLMQDMLVTVVQAGLQDTPGSIEKLDLSIRQWEVERYKQSLKS
jgi:glucose-6-phosphate isomerase